jgi:hypothetical protein
MLNGSNKKMKISENEPTASRAVSPRTLLRFAEFRTVGKQDEEANMSQCFLRRGVSHRCLDCGMLKSGQITPQQA